MSLLPLTASLGHWLSVTQKILSVGQLGFLGRVLKQPFFLFSFSISLSRKPLTVLVLGLGPLLFWDKGAAREAQLPVVSGTTPSIPETSVLPLLSCTVPAARSLPKCCCMSVTSPGFKESKSKIQEGQMLA